MRVETSSFEITYQAVSLKRKANVVARTDGGFRHLDCRDNAERAAAKRFRAPYTAKERREHRNAVRIAVTRDGAIR